jgi:hypothetical protein
MIRLRISLRLSVCRSMVLVFKRTRLVLAIALAVLHPDAKDISLRFSGLELTTTTPAHYRPAEPRQADSSP